MADDAVIGVSNSSFCLTADGPAHVVLDPQGYASSRATTGLVPVAPARVLLDASGGFCVYTLEGADVIVYLTAVSRDDGARYHPVRPVRLVDTRQASVPDQHRGGSGRPLDAGGVVRFPASSWRGVPANAAVAVNVTSVEPSADGYVAAWDCSMPQPSTSVQNSRRAEAVASQTVVSSGGEICVMSATPAHMIVDLARVWVR